MTYLHIFFKGSEGIKLSEVFILLILILQVNIMKIYGLFHN